MLTLNQLDKKSPNFWLFVSILLTAVIISVDILSGYELSFSLFYLLPVALTAWAVSKRAGIIMSAVCALCWITADILSGHTYTHPAIPYWNAMIRFSVFLIVALLISALRKAHDYEKEIARIDSLTGAVNSRFFCELLQMEVNRMSRTRSPFTIVYMDVDNFKYINDHLGHSAGDQVLRTIAYEAKNKLRKVDVVARLGGDEFAFLLPDTGKEDAIALVTNIQSILIDAMHRNNWPVTFSIGALTCNNIPDSIDNLIKQADILMYSAKHSGKDSASFADYNT